MTAARPERGVYWSWVHERDGRQVVATLPGELARIKSLLVASESGEPPGRSAREGLRSTWGRVLDFCGQATKGVWGMSRCQKAMKGVEVCDKPGGIDKRVVIPGFPN